MSVLIKAEAAARAVRPLAPCKPAQPATLADPPAPASESRLAELETENARLREALEKALDDAAEARRAAGAAAREAAAEAARAEGAERLDALDKGIAEAFARWDETLGGLDRLAPLIARTALSKLFEPADDLAELVGRAIARQMAGLRRDTAVRLRVSGRDFPDDEAIDRLRAGGGTGRLEIVCDPDLVAGECRLELGLGHVEVGPRAQWRELSALLESFAGEGEAA